MNAILLNLSVAAMFCKTAFFRQIDAWNTLPVELRCINSLAGFKRRIKSVNFITFLKGSAYKTQQVV